MAIRAAGKRIILLFFFLCPLLASTQEQVLKVTDHSPEMDGMVREGEYSLAMDFGRMRLYLSRNEKNFYAAVEAETAGWVAAGFGSSRMQDARMVIGYVEDGKALIAEQLGSGHRHTDVKEPLLAGYSLSEKGGRTVLEAVFRSEDLIRSGDSLLEMIVAFGGQDSFTSMHQFRRGFKVKL